MTCSKLHISSLIFLLSFSASFAQPDLNQTDGAGRKQGHWIRKYPTGIIMYEGTFRDNHPVGEFRRYYDNGVLLSLMNFSPDGTAADASLFHPNGFIAAKGRYLEKLKEGRWQFFSSSDSGYLLSEEIYLHNVREGEAIKYWPDGKIAERVFYTNGVKNGEWQTFYDNGNKWIRSAYRSGNLDGTYETWYEDGTVLVKGKYRNNIREGTWLFFNENGSEKYRITYTNGVPDNNKMDLDAENMINMLEKNSKKIPDPEVTGEMW